ncbi:NADPH-dependent FMN reductase [Pseudogracilibacillus sp. ICA-222130]|uniref:NADPH-dependent FMN reductase n=1 Tax=Pseudogracilibacillus sp. ICA-222130 TaxID=3134655 RepID=UPI0030C12911
MSDIVFISGSPRAHSRSERILFYLASLFQKKGYTTSHISVTDIPAEDLLYANFTSNVIQETNEKIAAAKGVIIGSPVYKAAYSGALKTLIDLLPQDGLRGKPVLPIMTGGSAAHLLAIDFAFNPLIHAVKGEPLQGLYFQDEQIDSSKENPIQDSSMLERTEKQINIFEHKLKEIYYEIV